MSCSQVPDAECSCRVHECLLRSRWAGQPAEPSQDQGTRSALVPGGVSSFAEQTGHAETTRRCSPARTRGHRRAPAQVRAPRPLTPGASQGGATPTARTCAGSGQQADAKGGSGLSVRTAHTPVNVPESPGRAAREAGPWLRSSSACPRCQVCRPLKRGDLRGHSGRQLRRSRCVRRGRRASARSPRAAKGAGPGPWGLRLPGAWLWV